ncbi:hypothetical protein DAEQUDRAFT_733593 [Daedalea quercina L-15889]|uniref:Uncharacterized protein n=1 Tax=Daedalea quercina L-15889 TaxID=1314783 RepID=A0A165KV76_9APHY|nr:hypothetical protein DAEQUDRAFT_733593 [Daedalea quercina L-15889]
MVCSVSEEALFAVKFEAAYALCAALWFDQSCCDDFGVLTGVSRHEIAMSRDKTIQACRRPESAAGGAPFLVKREEGCFDAFAADGLAGYDACRIAREELVEMVVRRGDKGA